MNSQLIGICTNTNLSFTTWNNNYNVFTSCCIKNEHDIPVALVRSNKWHQWADGCRQWGWEDDGEKTHEIGVYILMACCLIDMEVVCSCVYQTHDEEIGVELAIYLIFLLIETGENLDSLNNRD